MAESFTLFDQALQDAKDAAQHLDDATTHTFSAPALAFCYDRMQPGKPIHMLRTGTFIDSAGNEATFTAETLASIVANFDKRPNPPITENHDWGKAVGRITAIYTDATGDNLYGVPTWNANGTYLLEQQVYDAFSVELRDLALLIGGSLTNYPAVDGLAAVTLSAPLPTQQERPMPEETNPTAEAEITPPQPDFTALFSAMAGGTFTAEMTDRMTAQLTAAMQQQMTYARQQAEAAAARQIAEFQAQQQISAFAQHVTTPTIKRAYALPTEPARIEKFLLSLSGAQRTEAQALFSHIVEAGLVSFDELGSAGEGEGEVNPIVAYEAAVADRIKLGMTKSAAISAVNREERGLAAAYNAARQKGSN